MNINLVMNDKAREFLHCSDNYNVSKRQVFKFMNLFKFIALLDYLNVIWTAMHYGSRHGHTGFVYVGNRGKMQ